jgi:hypothetical protein
MRKIDTLSLDERKTLAADIEAFLKKATAEDDKLIAVSNKLATDIEAGLRRHEANRLLSELYGSSYGHDELRVALESVLAEPPPAPLNDDARIKLRRRHEAMELVKKIVALKGPLSAETEQDLQQKLERVMVATAVSAPWEPTNTPKRKSRS